MERLTLTLVDPSRDVCDEWRKAFESFSEVAIVNDRFESLADFDCMVSAANSFGLMDGGVDRAIVDYFGVELMDRVQQRILDEYLGEQPVGTSFVIETGHPRHPYVAHTPTMRVPMAIATTDNVYVAMWAMLLAVHAHNREASRRIQTIACPGLGTATGRMPAREAARQMASAYRWYRNRPTTITWPYAEIRQGTIGRGGDLRLADFQTSG
jgi:O-acetyl-ADP-ribose deacetylase (regulator of RNase III)